MPIDERERGESKEKGRTKENERSKEKKGKRKNPEIKGIINNEKNPNSNDNYQYKDNKTEPNQPEKINQLKKDILKNNENQPKEEKQNLDKKND